MILRSLSISGFATYAKLERAFPPRGLILVVGDNGAGKSSLYEAVSWLLHKETVRGGKVAEAKGTLSFGERGEEYTVKRAQTPRTHKVEFKNGDVINLTGATPTETQKTIDATVGSHGQFEATVFARDLLAKMALATDKQRKALLEEALGLGRFDKALAAATAQKQIAKGALAVADAKLPLLGQRVVDFEARLDGLSKKVVRPAEVVERELADLGPMPAWRPGDVGRAALEVDEAETTMRSMEQAVRRASERRDALQRKIGQQHEGCPECGRPYDAATQEMVIGEAKEQLAALGDLGRREFLKAKVRYETLKEEHEEVTKAQEAARAAFYAVQATRLALEGELEMARTIGQQRHSVEEDLLKARFDFTKAQVERDDAVRNLRLLEACCTALGLKGARNLMLGRALRRVDHEANLFLGQVHPHIRVDVQPDEDAVAVRVKGAGGGEYRGCSGSQRVLIDVALVLGVAALRSGDGMLVFDEVFDSLDARYAEAVAAFLSELARTRQVIVISHHEQARSMFRPAACWRAVLDADGVSTMEDA